MVFSKEYNYLLIGPGASGKSYLCAKSKRRVGKFPDVPDQFFAVPCGLVAYASPNCPLDAVIEIGVNYQVKIVLCRCDEKILKQRLVDRFQKRMKKYTTKKKLTEALEIFVKNYTYDYAKIEDQLTASGVTWEIADTSG